jgi:hypothetical protein
MLEYSSLLLGPWHAAAAGEADTSVRAITDATGTELGFIRRPPPPGSRWLRWLGRRVLEVCETPDASLVFTLRRGLGWPAGWELVDADSRLVGTLRGRAMLDGFGHLLAVIEQPDSSGRGRLLAIEGRELGDYVLSANGLRINFATELEGNPFARMLLLGALIVGSG